MVERRKKNKRKIIICALAVVAIILVVLLIIFLVKKGKNGDEKESQEEEVIYELPDTTYTGMTVTDIALEYLEDQNKTSVSFVINNTTDRTINEEVITAYLLNDAGEVLKSMNSYIQQLGVGEQYSVSVIFNGDFSATKQISLQRVDSASSTTETSASTTETKTEEKKTEEKEETDKKDEEEDKKEEDTKTSENTTEE